MLSWRSEEPWGGSRELKGDCFRIEMLHVSRPREEFGGKVNLFACFYPAFKARKTTTKSELISISGVPRSCGVG